MSGEDGVALDPLGNMYISDTGSNHIRKVSVVPYFPVTAVGLSSVALTLNAVVNTADTLSTAAVAASFKEFILGTLGGCTLGSSTSAGTDCAAPVTFTPQVAGFQSAPVTITDTAGNISSIGVRGLGLAPSVAYTPGTISTTSGTGTAGFSGDGATANLALLNGPTNSVMDSGSNAYIADSGNNVIRQVNPSSGIITTIAGTGIAGYRATRRPRVLPPSRLQPASPIT